MAQNTFHKDRPAQNILLAQQIVSAATGNPTSFGLSAPQLAALTATADVVNGAIVDYEVSKAACQSAKEFRDTSANQLIDQLAVIARAVYAKDGLSNAQIASTGLAIHDNYPTPGFVSEPTNLVVKPQTNGYVNLKWSRSGNKSGSTFMVQTSTDNETWNTVFATTRTRCTLSYFAPGEQAFFRVFAQRNDEVSPPSESVGIYFTAPGNAIQIAA